MNRFRADPKFTLKYRHSDDLERKLNELAEETAGAARKLAAARAFETGAYMASIRAESGDDGRSRIGRVNAHDPASGYIEFGTKNMPPEAILRRALEATFGTANITTRRR